MLYVAPFLNFIFNCARYISVKPEIELVDNFTTNYTLSVHAWQEQALSWRSLLSLRRITVSETLTFAAFYVIVGRRMSTRLSFVLCRVCCLVQPSSPLPLRQVRSSRVHTSPPPILFFEGLVTSYCGHTARRQSAE